MRKWLIRLLGGYTEPKENAPVNVQVSVERPKAKETEELSEAIRGLTRATDRLADEMCRPKGSFRYGSANPQTYLYNQK